ncbi:MAG: hypothetical protein QXK94_03330 [Candidatus Jordarchaeales archaeon]
MPRRKTAKRARAARRARRHILLGAFLLIVPHSFQTYTSPLRVEVTSLA